jgi:colicin import membrane protein
MVARIVIIVLIFAAVIAAIAFAAYQSAQSDGKSLDRRPAADVTPAQPAPVSAVEAVAPDTTKAAQNVIDKVSTQQAEAVKQVTDETAAAQAQAQAQAQAKAADDAAAKAAETAKKKAEEEFRAFFTPAPEVDAGKPAATPVAPVDDAANDEAAKAKAAADAAAKAVNRMGGF